MVKSVVKSFFFIPVMSLEEPVLRQKCGTITHIMAKSTRIANSHTQKLFSRPNIAISLHFIVFLNDGYNFLYITVSFWIIFWVNSC